MSISSPFSGELDVSHIRKGTVRPVVVVVASVFFENEPASPSS